MEEDRDILIKPTIKKSLILLAVTGAIVLGAFFRFYNLSNNVVRDEDVLIYSLYSIKLHEVLKVAASPQFLHLFREYKKTGSEETLEGSIRNLKRDSRFIAMTSSIPKTDQVYPDWIAKPAYILMGALFRGVHSGNNFMLFLSAMSGLLVLFLTFFLIHQVVTSYWSSLSILFLVALSPMMVGYSRTGHANMTAALFMATALWTYLKSLEEDRSYFLLATGMTAGLAILCHPVALFGMFFLFLTDLLVTGKNFYRSVFRISHLGIGLLVTLLLAEVCHLAASNISMLFAGRLIKPFLYSLLTHGIETITPQPFFYLSAMTLYEGIPFMISAFAGAIYLARQKNLNEKQRASLLLGIVPVLFLSFFSGHLYVALRNIIVFMIPIYLVIGIAADQFFQKCLPVAKRRILPALIILGTIHTACALHTNWDSAHYRVGLDELKQYLETIRQPVVFIGASRHFAEVNLRGNILPDKFKDNPPLSFYWETESQVSGNQIVKEFHTDVFDHKIFALETPEFMSVWLDPLRRKTRNRIFITQEKP